MNNSIINSLKRLERVGQENSRVTGKLKIACEEVGELLEKRLKPFQKNIEFQSITGKLYFDLGELVFNYDNNLHIMNQHRYQVCPKNEYITRECALYFAEAIANGLLEKVSDWITKKNIESQIAVEQVTII